jgi:catechol 2,3-dioxygenase-like lactoylglutathione lyase family enzyme
MTVFSNPPAVSLSKSTFRTNRMLQTTGESTMNTPRVALGYVILFVRDVSASLAFYEKAFGLSRRFFNDDNGKTYGELETGAACLAFASLELARAQLNQEVVVASPDKAPLGVEFALVAPNVPKLYSSAVRAGASSVKEPTSMPWGQTVAYVRDPDGHLVELCSPVAG